MINKQPLGEVASFINGRAFKPEEWSDEGKPIIRIQNLTGTSKVFNYFAGDCEDRYRVCEGDILISWSASLGVYVWHGKDAVLNQHIFKVKLRDSIDKAYFHYAAQNALGEMISRIHGATMQHITKDQFDTIQIPVPPLPEQKRIAALLDKADRLRRARRYARKLSDGFLQSVFLEMFGDPVTNPLGWKQAEVEEMCNVIVDCPHYTPKSFSTNKTAYPFIRTSDIQLGYLDWSTTKYVDLKEYTTRVSRYRPTTDDVIYSREGERFGLAARVPCGVTPCLGQRVMLLQPDPMIATSEYLWALMNSPAIYQQACQIVGGSTSPHVNVGDIKAFKAFLPPLNLQRKFSALVQCYDRLYSQQREAERQAEHLFQTLLRQAFSGNR